MEEGLGWSSEGWSESRAAAELAKLKEAARTGEGARTLQEKRQNAKEARQTEQARRKAEEKALEQDRLDNVTLGEFFKEVYFPVSKNSKKQCSWAKEEQHFLRWIDPVFGHKSLKAVTGFDLEKLKKHMTTAGMSPRSIEYVMVTTRQVYRYARRIDRFQGDQPTTKVRKPRFDNRRMRFLSAVESNRLMTALAERSQDLADMARLSLDCGLRAGEIFGLVWSGIDEVRGLIVLRDTKNTTTKHAYMTSTVRELMARRDKGGPNELIFPSPRGAQRPEIGQLFRKVVAELGFNRDIDDRREKGLFSHAKALIRRPPSGKWSDLI